jgi:uncharacterized membrane protein YraQ (UPF0718 family)
MIDQSDAVEAMGFAALNPSYKLASIPAKRCRPFMPWYQRHSGDIAIWGAFVVSAFIAGTFYVLRNRLKLFRPCLLCLGIIPMIVLAGICFALPSLGSLPFWLELTALSLFVSPNFALCFLLAVLMLVFDSFQLLRIEMHEKLLCRVFATIHALGLSWVAMNELSGS